MRYRLDQFQPLQFSVVKASTFTFPIKRGRGDLRDVLHSSEIRYKLPFSRKN